jgi:hypothetical protein
MARANQTKGGSYGLARNLPSERDSGAAEGYQKPEIEGGV